MVWIVHRARTNDSTLARRKFPARIVGDLVGTGLTRRGSRSALLDRPHDSASPPDVSCGAADPSGSAGVRADEWSTVTIRRRVESSVSSAANAAIRSGVGHAGLVLDCCDDSADRLAH